MKFFSAAGVLLCLVGLAYGYFSPAIPHPASVILNSLSNYADEAGLPIGKRSATHTQRVTRQSSDDIIKCFSPAVRMQCESDFQPHLIQNALDCGENFVARYLAGVCDRTSSGDVCGLLAFQELENLSSESENSVCTSFVQGSSCPSGCASRLESLRDSLGCCINSVFNFSVDASEDGTGDTLSQAFQSAAILDMFTYPLWSACEVDTVGMCESSATITPIHNSRACTTFEFTQRGQFIQCNSADEQKIVDSIIAAGDQCYDIAVAQSLSCSARFNGQYCSAIVSAGVNNTQSVTPAGIGLECLEDQQSCSSGCRSAIQNVERTLGCCFNSFYNISLNQGAFDFHASNELWDQCGVDTPGVCENNLVVSGSSAASKAMSLLVLAFLAALVQYFY